MKYRFASDVDSDARIWVHINKPTPGIWDTGEQFIKVWSTGKVESHVFMQPWDKEAFSGDEV